MAFRNEIIKDAPTAISSSANDFGYSLMQFLKCCKVNFQKKDPPVSQKKFGASDNIDLGNWS
ncbi:hypothetical protein FHT21_001780 [Pedobacter sp. SG908]|nr:hypothetical protein [Pedobacter sp. SG908]NMN36753.1 hypothetical protein [Pedobacter sp. SG918]